MLDQALGLLDDHLGHLDVARCRLVKRRRHNLAAHRALHVGDFFRALIDEQHDEVGVRVVGGHALRQILHQHGLTGLGRRDDQPALSLTERRDDIDDSCGDVFGAAIAHFHDQLLFREQRGQILEGHFALGLFRRFTIDGVDLEQREIALIVFRCPNLAGNAVAGAQREASNLRWGDVDVVRAGLV